MSITDQQFEQLREAASEDRKDDFARLIEAIVNQTIRDRLARREASRPARPWIPQEQF